MGGSFFRLGRKAGVDLSWRENSLNINSTVDRAAREERGQRHLKNVGGRGPKQTGAHRIRCYVLKEPSQKGMSRQRARERPGAKIGK